MTTVDFVRCPEPGQTELQNMAPTNPMHLLAAIVAVALFSTARAGLLLDADARGGVLMDGADRKWQDKSGNGKHCGLGTGVQWDAAHQVREKVSHVRVGGRHTCGSCSSHVCWTQDYSRQFITHSLT